MSGLVLRRERSGPPQRLTRRRLKLRVLRKSPNPVLNALERLRSQHRVQVHASDGTTSSTDHLVCLPSTGTRQCYSRWYKELQKATDMPLAKRKFLRRTLANFTLREQATFLRLCNIQKLKVC